MWDNEQWDITDLRMSYRPRIPDDVHERVQRHTIGEQINKNQIYIDLIKVAYDEDGTYSEWLSRIDTYCQRNDCDKIEVLSHIITEVIDKGGEPNIKYKEKLQLD